MSVARRGGAARGIAPLTQFGRMCAQLAIQIIPASSPQAKGRIERQHGTQQDRLIKKLRRAGITTYAAANTFVTGGYLTDHNARFARRAGVSREFPSPSSRGTRRSTRIFQLEETRTLSNDWVVRLSQSVAPARAREPSDAGAQHGPRVRGARWPAHDSVSRPRAGLAGDRSRPRAAVAGAGAPRPSPTSSRHPADRAGRAPVPIIRGGKAYGDLRGGGHSISGKPSAIDGGPRRAHVPPRLQGLHREDIPNE